VVSRADLVPIPHVTAIAGTSLFATEHDRQNSRHALQHYDRLMESMPTSESMRKLVQDISTQIKPGGTELYDHHLRYSG
jgi:hypothetical protein